MGVRRAVEMAWQASAANVDLPAGQAAGQNRQVYTLGPLIHNPRVLEDLEERGIRVLNEGEIDLAWNPALNESENPTVIIRAHGIAPQTEAGLARLNVRVLDATCPHVKVSQMKARSFAERGYRIFLAGEENHAEIAGILGYAQTSNAVPSCYVVGNPSEAESAALELSRREPGAKTVLIGQTTISTQEYGAISERLRQFFPGIEIVDTICGATADRQDALRELCGKADAVIVVGGRESANTRRLLSLARELGKPAWLAETVKDLPPEIKVYKTVGLCAGASTPDSLISEIEEALAKF